MARPIWNGQIAFGLVTVPVGLYSAEQGKELSFHMLDRRNQARVRYQRVNEVTGDEVPWDEIVKGYEYEKGQYVILTDEDFERVAVEQTKSIDIEDFVDQEAIDYVYFEKPYYLVPTARAAKAYALLRETLRRTKKAGIGRFVIRNKQHLAAVMAEGDAIILCVLRFQHELRDIDELELPAGLDKAKVSKKELDMAEQLVATMTSDWEPEKYKDDYQDRLLAWIEEKAKSGDMSPPPEVEVEEGGGKVLDLMSALRRSIAGERLPEPAPLPKRTHGRKSARPRVAAKRATKPKKKKAAAAKKKKKTATKRRKTGT